MPFVPSKSAVDFSGWHGGVSESPPTPQIESLRAAKNKVKYAHRKLKIVLRGTPDTTHVAVLTYFHLIWL